MHYITLIGLFTKKRNNKTHPQRPAEKFIAANAKAEKGANAPIVAGVWVSIAQTAGFASWLDASAARFRR